MLLKVARVTRGRNRDAGGEIRTLEDTKSHGPQPCPIDRAMGLPHIKKKGSILLLRFAFFEEKLCMEGKNQI